MGKTLLETKKRIASISSTYKVTSAMKLVSTVKLRSLMAKMENYRYFASEIKDVFSYLSNNIGENKSPFFNPTLKGKKLYILISSTLGLCGSYNYNLFEKIDSEYDKEDDILILGNKGKNHYKDYDNVLLLEKEENDYELLAEEIVPLVIDKYLDGTYREICIVYTKYKNSITFIPEIEKILPLVSKDNDDYFANCLIEPDKETVLNELIPLYISSIIKGRILESFTSEQASRRNAMENASDNAKDIISELQLEFNKARQSQITSEIIDIVGASSAQKGEN